MLLPRPLTRFFGIEPDAALEERWSQLPVTDRFLFAAHMKDQAGHLLFALLCVCMLVVSLG